MDEQRCRPLAVSLTDACEMLAISRSELYRLRKEHDFPEVRIGRRVIVPVDAAQRWLEERIGQTVGTTDDDDAHGIKRD